MLMVLFVVKEEYYIGFDRVYGGIKFVLMIIGMF